MAALHKLSLFHQSGASCDVISSALSGGGRDFLLPGGNRDPRPPSPAGCPLESLQSGQGSCFLSDSLKALLVPPCSRLLASFFFVPKTQSWETTAFRPVTKGLLVPCLRAVVLWACCNLSSRGVCPCSAPLRTAAGAPLLQQPQACPSFCHLCRGVSRIVE